MTDDELRIALYDVTEDFYNIISSNDPIDVREELNSFIRRLDEIRKNA